jgi:Tfp pilus assembly protein PilV
MQVNTLTSNVRGKAAYTLAEVMIAVFFISIMMVSLYAGFWSGFAIAKMSRENLRATQILIQKLEAVRIYNWTQINNQTNYTKTNFVDYYNPSGTSNGTYGAVYKGVCYVTTPTNLPAAYNSKMREITLNLYWTNYLRSSTNVIVRSRQMKTYFARYGMQDYLY